MWIGGTLLRLPIAVKSTDINIHGLSIHLHHTAAGIKSTNFGILAPHDRRRRREREVCCSRKD